MKVLSAAAVIFTTALLAAGCSSSVDNAPDVGPTDPTMGNGAPPTSGSLSPDRALFSPNQGVLPYPHDAYFTPSPGVPTDGTLNLPSSAFFPATVRIPGTTVTEPVVGSGCWPAWIARVEKPRPFQSPFTSGLLDRDGTGAKPASGRQV